MTRSLEPYGHDGKAERHAACLRQSGSRACAKLVHSADLSPQTASWFDFKTVFKGKTNERLDFNKTAVMAVYVAVRNEDGTLRTDPNGRPIGYRWFKKLLKQHPYHDKAGTARSNLMWHFLRNALHEKENGRDQQGRAAFRKALKELFRALQKD